MLFVVYYKCYLISTYWGRDKITTNFPTTFSNAFSWMKMYEFRLKFHWSWFLRVQLTILQFRKWLCAVQATSHYLKQWWLVYRRINASLGLNELNRYSIFIRSFAFRVQHLPVPDWSITDSNLCHMAGFTFTLAMKTLTSNFTNFLYFIKSKRWIGAY